MKIKMSDNCGTCKYSFTVQMNMGCRAHPPTLFTGIEPDMIMGGQPRMSVRSMFPPVTGDFWCGEYQPKDKE